MATQQERKTKTRSTILRSAKKCFENHGFDETTLDQLINEANVAKGTFYQHFKSKLEVLIAIEREAGRKRARKALAAISAGRPAVSILEKYLESLAEWFEAREKIAEAMVLSSLTKADDEMSTHPELSSRGFIHAALESAQNEGVVRKDVDAWALTAMLCGAITVSVLGWSRNPQQGHLKSMLKQSLMLFLEGAQSKGRHS